MAKNGWNRLEIGGNGWEMLKCLDMSEITGLAANDVKRLAMAVNS